jgi:hypothetical protein
VFPPIRSFPPRSPERFRRSRRSGRRRGTLSRSPTLAAVVALAAKREFFRKPLGAVLGIGALAATALPSQLSGAGEFAAAFVPALAAGAWLGFSALFLLADHAAAWIFFGIFAFGGPTVVELLSQGARADRVAGGSRRSSWPSPPSCSSPDAADPRPRLPPRPPRRLRS